MCETCNHITTYQQLRRTDPTKTSVLRATFVRDMNRRFNRIKKLIVESVVKKDCFGLTDKIQTNAAVPANSFKFLTNPQKVESFMNWLNRQIEQELLTVEFRSQLGQASQAPWTNMYISDSYKRGINTAATQATKAKIPGMQTIEARGGIQAVMSTPFHMDRLGMLYTRTFTELKGITAAMDNQISKVLAQGIADGDSPAAIARKLNKTIGGGLELTVKNAAGIPTRTIPPQVRAATLARTEVIRAHHSATVQEYRNWGVEGVKVKAEWSTAMDDRVCELCAPLEGRVYTLDEIEGMIPFHPNCHCLALPYLDDTKESKKTRGSSVPTTSVPKKKVTEKTYSQTHTQAGRQFNYNELTSAQKKAVEEYQAGFINSEIGGVRTLQEWTRLNTIAPSTKAQGITETMVKKYVKDLDEAIKQAVVIEDTQVLRGIRNIGETFGITDEALFRPGLRFTDKGYTSTTTSTKVAKKFATKLNNWDSPKILHIELGSGQNAFPISVIGDVFEAEVLLPRNLTYEITRIQGNNVYVKIIK